VPFINAITSDSSAVRLSFKLALSNDDSEYVLTTAENNRVKAIAYETIFLFTVNQYYLFTIVIYCY
jgi:hypothetical protein